jgi:hypothetical protein
MINRFGFLDVSPNGVIFIPCREAVMHIRRVVALCLGLVLALPSYSVAQNPQKDEKKRNKQEQQDIETLAKLVDGVTMGQQQAPADIPVTWDSHHFVKGQDGRTYIPFTIKIDRSKLAAPGVAMFVRVMSKKPAATTPTGTAGEKKDEQKNKDDRIEYPWENVHFLDVPENGLVSRAMAVAGGEYEMFVAVKEKGTGDRKQPPQKIGLLRHDLTVPDYSAAELNTSSVILAESVEPVQTALSNDQQQENPYTFGTMKIVPSRDPKFKKDGELQVVFWIYGATPDASKKPDVQIEYNFHQKLAEGEKYFNKTSPQQLNATTLPPQFDMAAGHQLPGSLVVPLATFPPGDYRLEIKVTDKPSGKTLTRDVTFSVVG